MILDHTGRSVRRSIGFVRELVHQREPKADISTHACGFETPCEEYQPFEECMARSPDGRLSTTLACTTSSERAAPVLCR
jgi:hypothetical protein